ncbi:hypothetical protein SLEP1_g52706 [Rubroshorea leprosula]|uniref:Uncharacterized protein n=1 Tax=Rubroshorea leprosula TaxID=152421 RepID=A0AAV5M8V3_9ROSI|nr:hypothetical protein SLEP1_g52706 [Rubroshorea leprosula]
MKMERTIRMTVNVVLLIILMIAIQILNGDCSRPVSQGRDPGSPSGPCNCTYVPGGPPSKIHR